MEEISNVVKKELYSAELADECLLPFLSGAIRGSGEVSLLRTGYEVEFIHADKEFIDLLSDVVYRLEGVKTERTETVIDGEKKYTLYIDSHLSNILLERCMIVKDKYELIQGIPEELFPSSVDRADINLPEDLSSAAKRAYLRGLYLSCGNLRVPDDIEEWSQNKTKSGYLLSLNLNSYYVEDDVIKLIVEQAETDASSVMARPRGFTVFIKNSQVICNFLTAIGSNIGVLRLYEVITNRKMKNDMNRLQNFEIANIDKTVFSSARQIAAIKEVDKKIGLKNLSDGLRLVCEYRLQNVEAGLEEIAKMFDPPVTKSCVNHRMRRIMELAKK